MQKILLVDIGNSRIKWSVAENGVLSEQSVCVWPGKGFEQILDDNWNKLDQICAIKISNVAGKKIGKTICKWCKRNWQITPTFAKVCERDCGVKNSYSNPEKLGIDRWLAMLAGWNIVKSNVCIIDCGSAITIDVVDSSGTHKGGVIAPGLALSERALTDHTHALSVQKNDEITLLASDTEAAINSGCYHQLIGGVEYLLTKIMQQFGSDIECIFTGGDAEMVIKGVDLSVPGIKLRHEPTLVLQGLKLSSK
ncbi:MAG: type III pantothenate kinase [Gammaproteobacteria bacterium]